MKKNLQRFGASVLAAAMVAQSVALPAAAETTKIDSSVTQSVAASAASAASAVQSLPKFTSTADLIKQTAQTLAAQGEVHELEQDDAKLEATAQSKAGMSLAALENALADAMYANAAAGKINTEAYGLNKDEMASVMAATIKTYHLSSAVTDLGYETNAAGVVTAVTFTGSSGMTSAMESMTNSDDEVIAQQADSYAQAYVAENSDTFAASAAADPNVIAMHYYGVDITWATVFRKVDATARALQVLGIKQGDQIPVFLRSVPEFIYLLLAAERIGASLLCRDNTLEENIEAVQKANAKVIFVHDFFSKAEIEAYREQTNVNTYVIVPALESGDRAAMPVYLQHSLDALYPDVPARGSDTMMWADFCNMGQRFRGFVPAPVNIDRPLLRAYTSGSTGPSKQVIHSAHSIIGVLTQMNFYGSSDKFRPTWLLTILPPALIAVVVSMMLLPLAGGMLLILDPFVDVYDVDLEMMRYRPNNWPLIPMFVEVIRRSKRLPADYDMSHMLAIGAGCEAFNNKQLRNVEEFLKQHNCNLRFTAGYGSSEAGSNATLPMAPFPVRDGNVGVPMIHSVISIFKPGTQEELTYNTPGEICMTGPGVMLGYDRPEATAKALQVHADGKTWLHTGDIGYMSEDGVLYTMTRGASPRFGGGDLMVQPLENIVADADIKGIKDEFFVIVPDDEHEGCFLPYLYVQLKDGYTLDDVRDKINACLPERYMRPVEIFTVPERPFFHFKTNRIGLCKEIVAKRNQQKEKAKRNSFADGCIA